MTKATIDLSNVCKQVASRQEPTDQKMIYDNVFAVCDGLEKYLVLRKEGKSPEIIKAMFLEPLQNILKALKPWFESQKRKQNEVDFANKMIVDALKRLSSSNNSSTATNDTVDNLCNKVISLISQIETNYQMDFTGVVLTSCTAEIIDTNRLLMSNANNYSKIVELSTLLGQSVMQYTSAKLLGKDKEEPLHHVFEITKAMQAHLSSDSSSSSNIDTKDNSNNTITNNTKPKSVETTDEKQSLNKAALDSVEMQQIKDALAALDKAAKLNTSPSTGLSEEDLNDVNINASSASASALKSLQNDRVNFVVLAMSLPMILSSDIATDSMCSNDAKDELKIVNASIENNSRSLLLNSLDGDMDAAKAAKNELITSINSLKPALDKVLTEHNQAIQEMLKAEQDAERKKEAEIEELRQIQAQFIEEDSQRQHIEKEQEEKERNEKQIQDTLAQQLAEQQKQIEEQQKQEEIQKQEFNRLEQKRIADIAAAEEQKNKEEQQHQERIQMEQKELREKEEQRQITITNDPNGLDSILDQMDKDLHEQMQSEETPPPMESPKIVKAKQSAEELANINKAIAILDEAISKVNHPIATDRPVTVFIQECEGLVNSVEEYKPVDFVALANMVARLLVNTRSICSVSSQCSIIRVCSYSCKERHKIC